MAKPRTPKTAPQPDANRVTAAGVVVRPTTKSIIRYPTAGNALRAHLDVVRTGAALSREHEQRRQDKQEKKSGKALASRRLELLIAQLPSKPLVLKRRLPPGGNEVNQMGPSAAKSLNPSRPIAGAIFSTEALGETVRLRRLSLRLTQEQAARSAGVGRRFVVDLERGKPTLEIAKAFAVVQALGLTITTQVSGAD